jgi:hypothetical protein
MSLIHARKSNGWIYAQSISFFCLQMASKGGSMISRNRMSRTIEDSERNFSSGPRISKNKATFSYQKLPVSFKTKSNQYSYKLSKYFLYQFIDNK